MGALAHIAQAHACAEDQLLITPEGIYFRPSGPAPVRGASSDRQIDSRPAPNLTPYSYYGHNTCYSNILL